MFLISNTIKITIFARRKEIEIMKLVGATNWFIRLVLPGRAAAGVFGSIIPIALVLSTYQSMVAWVRKFRAHLFHFCRTARLCSKYHLCSF